jgi:hypothetical protein
MLFNTFFSYYESIFVLNIFFKIISIKFNLDS